MAGAIKKEHHANILSETANLISVEYPAPGPGVHGKAKEGVCEEVGLKEQEGVQREKSCG